MDERAELVGRLEEWRLWVMRKNASSVNVIDTADDLTWESMTPNPMDDLYYAATMLKRDGKRIVALETELKASMLAYIVAKGSIC